MSDSTERPKCGTCVHFEVRNRDEAMLAQIARPESECRPGEWVFRGERRVGCHGGPVRGACLRWQDVPSLTRRSRARSSVGSTRLAAP